MMERMRRAIEYSFRVKGRRAIRATWILIAIETCLLVLAIVLMVGVAEA